MLWLQILGMVTLTVWMITLMAVGLWVSARFSKKPYAKRRGRWAIALLILSGLLVILGFADEGWAGLRPVGAVLCAFCAIALFGGALFKDRARGRKRCPKCWYDMSGAEGLRCPECGRTAKNAKRQLRTRRHWRLALLAIVPALLATYLAVLPKVQRDGWLSIVPTTALIASLRLDDNDWAFNELHRRASPPSSGPAPSAIMMPDAFFRWQWRAIGDVCMKLIETDLPPQKRQKLLEWILYARDDDSAAAINTVFARLLSDPDPQMRSTCAIFVADVSDPDTAIERLLPLLHDESPTARCGAVTGLRILVQVSDKAVTHVGEALDDPDGTVRSLAMGALGRAADYRAVPDELVDHVRRLAEDLDVRVRSYQITCLMKLLGPDEQKTELKNAFRCDDPVRREGAIWALSDTAPDTVLEFLPELVARLGDENPSVRDAAVAQLQYQPIKALEPYEAQLRAALDPENRPETVEFITRALADLAEKRGDIDH